MGYVPHHHWTAYLSASVWTQSMRMLNLLVQARSNGADGTRTHNLLRAKETLSQIELLPQNFLLLTISWISDTIAANIEYLSSIFNIVYLHRPQAEVRLCCKLVGWKTSVAKLSKSLDALPVKRFSYYDFVFGPSKKLYNVLKKWYPKCRNVNYLILFFLRLVCEDRKPSK